MSPATAFVTGGAGFIGRHLVHQLVARGHPVRVLDPAASGSGFGPDVEVVRGSVLDRDTVTRMTRDAGLVFHLAANTHLWMPDKSSFGSVNTDGTRVVLEEAARAGVGRIVVTLTEVILRGWRDGSATPVNESEPTPRLEDMAGEYCRSKYLADQIADEAAREGLPVIRVYPTVPVGPGDNSITAPTQMIIDLIQGRLPGYLDGMINFVPVEDVARGHILAAELAAPGDRFILGGEDLRVRDLMAKLAEITGCPMPTLRVPYWAAVAGAATMELVADALTRRPPLAPLAGVRLAKHDRPIDSSKARRELGWQPGPVADALVRAVDWLYRRGLVAPPDSEHGQRRASGTER